MPIRYFRLHKAVQAGQWSLGPLKEVLERAKVTGVDFEEV